MRMVVIAFLLAPVALAERVEGIVTAGGWPLPGATVTLTSPGLTRITISDEHGRYQFAAVPAGPYELKFELAGLETATRDVVAEELTVVPAQELKVGPLTETMIYSCSLRNCEDGPITSKYGLPLCADRQLHDALIETANNGDRSSLRLLRQRYETADTSMERHRLAGELLRLLDDDAAIWKELSEEAAVAVTFPKTADRDFTPEFEDYCLQRAESPDKLWWSAYDAFVHAGKDPRSRDLLHRALRSDDRDLVNLAIASFAVQKDVSALGAIAEALKRIGDDAFWVAPALADFHSEEADALAFRYIPEEEQQRYLDSRK